jgi:hypothetical protein
MPRLCSRKGEGGGGVLDHGIPSNRVPGWHVENEFAHFVDIEAADESEAVDGAGGRDGHCVDEGDKGQALAQGKADHRGTGQESLSIHLHFWDLQYEEVVVEGCFSKMIFTPLMRKAKVPRLVHLCVSVIL